MTAPQPATPGSDSVRAQIRKALRSPRVSVRPIDGRLTRDSVIDIADALLPLVDRLCAEAKAEALEEAAHEQEAESELASWTKGSHAGGHQCAAGFARDRAAAYRTNPSEETHRG